MMRYLLAALLLFPFTAHAACEYAQLAVGHWSACTVDTAGAIECWGAEGGNNLITDVPTYAVDAVGDGYTSTCVVVDSDQSIHCWGDSDSTTETAGTYTDLAVGADSVCGLETDGTITCWGGAGVVAGYDVAEPGATYTQVSGEDDAFCGVLTTGALGCWGYDYATGLMTEPAGTAYDFVDASGSHACAHDTSNALACWGENANGQTTVPAGTWKAVAVQDLITCGIHTDDTIECWGSDYSGAITNEPSGSFDVIDGQAGTFCAIKTNGDVVCWGTGLNTTEVTSEVPAAGCPVAVVSTYVVIMAGM